MCIQLGFQVYYPKDLERSLGLHSSWDTDVTGLQDPKAWKEQTQMSHHKIKLAGSKNLALKRLNLET